MPDWALLALCGIIAATNLGALLINRKDHRER